MFDEDDEEHALHESKRLITIYERIKENRSSNATEEREQRIRELSEELRLRRR